MSRIGRFLKRSFCNHVWTVLQKSHWQDGSRASLHFAVLRCPKCETITAEILDMSLLYVNSESGKKVVLAMEKE